MDDYYALLGVGPAASAREIRAAFRQLAKLLHPDVSRLPSAAERFRRVMVAYETLSDPARRAAYDAGYRPAGPQRAGSAPGSYGPAGEYVAYGAPPSHEPNPQPAVPTVRPRTGRGAGPGSGGAAAPASKRPARSRGPVTPVTPVAPVGAVGTISAGERARRAAEAIRATAVRGRCVECGTLVSGDSDRCTDCLGKYGTFQEHLARAAARARRG